MAAGPSGPSGSSSLPPQYKDLIIGRIVERRVNGTVLTGEVMALEHIDFFLQKDDGETLQVRRKYHIVWSTKPAPEDRDTEHLDTEEVLPLLTHRFTDRAWFHPEIRHLQKAGWDESKVNTTQRDFDVMAWKAQRAPAISKKAGLHAHAMKVALDNGEFEIPPPPGPPIWQDNRDIPKIMPPSFYDSLSVKSNKQQVPIAWKLAVPRTISANVARQGCKVAANVELLKGWVKGGEDVQRMGRKVAAEAELLKGWVKVEKTTLAKLRKDEEAVRALATVRTRLTELKKALVSIEEREEEGEDLPVVLSSPVRVRGRVTVPGGQVIFKDQIQKKAAQYEKRIKDLCGCAAPMVDDVTLASNIARQETAIARAEELAKLAEQRLKDFEAAKGLIRINGAGYGVLSARAKNKAAAKPARVPKKASGAGPLSARPKPPAPLGAIPKKKVAKRPTPSAKKAGNPSKQAKKARTEPEDSDCQTVDPQRAGASSSSDSVAEPSAKETKLWPGEELVPYGQAGFVPKRVVVAEGDLPLEEWTRKEAAGELPDDGEFDVVALVAERKRRGKREFLVKWEGFELNPEQWFPLKDFEACVALDEWEQRCKAAKCG